MVLTSREFALSVLNVIALIPSKLLNVSGFQIIMNSHFLKSFFAIIPTCLKCRIIWVNFPVVGPRSNFSENAKKNLSAFAVLFSKTPSQASTRALVNSTGTERLKKNMGRQIEDFPHEEALYRTGFSVVQFPMRSVVNIFSHQLLDPVTDTRRSDCS